MLNLVEPLGFKRLNGYDLKLAGRVVRMGELVSACLLMPNKKAPIIGTKTTSFFRIFFSYFIYIYEAEVPH